MRARCRRVAAGRCLKEWGARYSTGGAWRKVTKTGKLARGTRYRLERVRAVHHRHHRRTEDDRAENCFDGMRARALAQARRAQGVLRG
jgi:hypothetical protein